MQKRAKRLPLRRTHQMQAIAGKIERELQSSKRTVVLIAMDGLWLASRSFFSSVIQSSSFNRDERRPKMVD
jgi:hypothetical protein